VISHVVLIKPRADLTSEESRAFVAAFERAILEIPTVRAVRFGHRVRHGAAYESLGPDMADYIAVIDFENLDGLRTYLAHPAHIRLGELFYRSLDAGMVYDFEIGSLELLHKLVQDGHRDKR
jgi:hypothetical protein